MHDPLQQEGGHSGDPVGHRAGDLANLVRELGESPRQCRDRAILLIAYGAGLGDQDTIHLRQRAVTVSPEGLVIDVPLIDPG